MLMFGLRLGNDPRVVVTTTPKPIRIIRELIADPMREGTVLVKDVLFGMNILSLAGFLVMGLPHRTRNLSGRPRRHGLDPRGCRGLRAARFRGA